MTAIEKIEKEELDNFKAKSKEMCLNSLTNSLVLFLFGQWLTNNYEMPQERQKVRDEVFSMWSKQILTVSEPMFININTALNDPKNRWSNLIDDAKISTEDYQKVFSESLVELKCQFNKFGA